MFLSCLFHVIMPRAVILVSPIRYISMNATGHFASICNKIVIAKIPIYYQIEIVLAGNFRKVYIIILLDYTHVNFCLKKIC